MTNKSKILPLFFLSVLCLFVLALGFFQIRGAIYGPFGGFKKSSAEQETALTQEEIFSFLLEQAKQEDTDEDGLFDYDEIYLYNTSPYIQDSDSDAFTDKEEIDAGSDPLDANSTPYRIISDSPKDDFWEEPIDSNLDSLSANNQEQAEFSIDYIKTFLIEQAGMSKEIVDSIDDNTLKKLYNDTKEETGIDPNGLGLSSSLEVDVSLLRQVLIDEGVDALMLEQIDDSTLRSMFLEISDN